MHNTDADHGKDSLSKKALTGGYFVFLIAFISFFGGLFQFSVLARLLHPEAFGLYALAMVVVTAGITFSNLGTDKILIQKPNLDSRTISTIWFLNIARGTVVALFCAGLAPLYGAFVNQPDAVPVLYTVALSPLFTSLRSPNAILQEREFRFARVAAFQITYLGLQIAVMIGLAYYLGDVMALAIGTAALALVNALLTWAWFGTPGWPRPHWAEAKELLGIGQHYLWISAGTFVTTQFDSFMVGKVLGAATLGLYNLSFKVSQWGIEIQNTVIGRIAFPLYSAIQNKTRELLGALDKLIQLQLFVLMPTAVGVAACAEAIVDILMGDQYQGAVPILQTLALVTLGRGVAHIFVPVIIGTGHVRFASRSKIVETFVFMLLVYWGLINFGVIGAAAGSGVAYLAAGMLRVWFVCRYLGYAYKNLAKHFLRSGGQFRRRRGRRVLFLFADCRADLRHTPAHDNVFCRRVFGRERVIANGGLAHDAGGGQAASGERVDVSAFAAFYPPR